MKKEHLLYLEKSNLELIASSIEITLELSIGNRCNYISSKKFSLDENKKTYRLKYDNSLKNIADIATIKLSTWIQLKVTNILEKPDSNITQTSWHRTLTYIVEKIESIKNIAFTDYQCLSPHEHMFSDEDKSNTLYIIQIGDSYSVFLEKKLKHKGYL